jgi:hypothetical protein
VDGGRKLSVGGGTLLPTRSRVGQALLVTLKRLDRAAPDDPQSDRLAGDVEAAVRRHVAADAIVLIVQNRQSIRRRVIG